MKVSTQATYSDFAHALVRDENLFLNRPGYLRASSRRFVATVELCVALVPNTSASVLDVGRSQQSYMLCQYYDCVTTLGLGNTEHGYGHNEIDICDASAPSSHITFDLNDTQYVDQLEQQIQFDLIVFSEVLEHLYTAPELVLRFLRNLLSANGVLVCVTPNAAALKNRWRLVCGENPFERIRANRDNPGHFREYTRNELLEIFPKAGLSVLQHRFADFATCPQDQHPIRRVFRGLLFWLSPAFMGHQVLVVNRHRG